MIQKNDLLSMVREAYLKRGIPWDEINIFGIRNEENQPEDIFNDFIGIATDSDLILFEATTDPGWYYTEKPFTVDGITGAAHLCLGYHPDIWMVDIHMKGRTVAHKALCQYGNAVKIWRDIDKDGIQDDQDIIQSGYFGINLHRAGITKTENIGLWSAGCQVIKSADDFKILLGTIESSTKYKRDSRSRFSYVLFDKSEIDMEVNNEESAA